MRQEFKEREIYETRIYTAWDLWERYLYSLRYMSQVFKQTKIYETGI